MDKDGKVIDYLNVMSDLNNKLIKTVGNPKERLNEDALRILRAIRFSTILDFKIEPKTKYYLKEYGYLLKDLSYQRKKQELDKIFTSKNKEKGIKLLLELELDSKLDIQNLKNIVPCSDLIGIWTQLNVDNVYPFTKLEKTQIKTIRKLLTLNIKDPYNIYTYGLYPSTVAFQIKKESISNLNKIYHNLPIKTRKEIEITGDEIAELLHKKPGLYIKEIMNDIEKEIVLEHLKNSKKEIAQYILKKYS